ncbi:hypothetical protein HYPDE_37278 [Hyphomicrobium denitrificans 1NES1]|uniref:Uncharacterized protein n=1 Tax=Hyphomicrobium denitrificans 1NES1 TaxID=670307 RepID=N0BA43_9HYPH|nr:hypothetical protein HYPDE_37278 [Hyphomicrobium denitrificans 1NES1]
MTSSTGKLNRENYEHLGTQGQSEVLALAARAKTDFRVLARRSSQCIAASATVGNGRWHARSRSDDDS